MDAGVTQPGGDPGPVFSFSVRRNALDWGAVNSVDLEDVVARRDTTALQRTFDTLCFSDICDRDIDLFTEPANAVQLFRLMQLTMEYQLHVQNALLETISAQKDWIDGHTTRNARLRRRAARLEAALAAKTAPTHTCGICSAAFSSAEFLARHTARRHPTPASGNDAGDHALVPIRDELAAVRARVDASGRTQLQRLAGVELNMEGASDDLLSQVKSHITAEANRIIAEFSRAHLMTSPFNTEFGLYADPSAQVTFPLPDPTMPLPGFAPNGAPAEYYGEGPSSAQQEASSAPSSPDSTPATPPSPFSSPGPTSAALAAALTSVTPTAVQDALERPPQHAWFGDMPFLLSRYSPPSPTRLASKLTALDESVSRATTDSIDAMSSLARRRQLPTDDIAAAVDAIAAEHFAAHRSREVRIAAAEAAHAAALEREAEARAQALERARAGAEAEEAQAREKLGELHRMHGLGEDATEAAIAAAAAAAGAGTPARPTPPIPTPPRAGTGGHTPMPSPTPSQLLLSQQQLLYKDGQQGQRARPVPPLSPQHSHYNYSTSTAHTNANSAHGYGHGHEQGHEQGQGVASLQQRLQQVQLTPAPSHHYQQPPPAQQQQQQQQRGSLPPLSSPVRASAPAPLTAHAVPTSAPPPPARALPPPARAAAIAAAHGHAHSHAHGHAHSQHGQEAGSGMRQPQFATPPATPARESYAASAPYADYGFGGGLASGGGGLPSVKESPSYSSRTLAAPTAAAQLSTSGSYHGHGQGQGQGQAYGYGYGQGQGQGQGPLSPSGFTRPSSSSTASSTSAAIAAAAVATGVAGPAAPA